MYDRISKADAQRKQVRFPYEASKQSYRVCMIVIPLIDLFILVSSTVFAIMERGTWMGWVCAIVVLMQVWILVKFIQNST